MKYLTWLLMLFHTMADFAWAQPLREDIQTNFVLYPQRVALYRDIRDRMIGKDFLLRLDSNTEYKFASACDAVSQFLLTGSAVETGLTTMFSSFDSLQPDTKRALLEAAYAVYPGKYVQAVKEIFSKENDPRLCSLCAAYLYRFNSSANNSRYLQTKLSRKFPGYDTIPVIRALLDYLQYHHNLSLGKTPGIAQLFRHQETMHQKIIYSFQRWNRDYPGLAIVQMADGHFARSPNGKLLVFEQLARSGSGLPYFLTNGNTPQGIFSIQGIAVSGNAFIGPTPNLQMMMPFEGSWEKFFLEPEAPDDSLEHYLQLLPAGWRNYAPMMESWNAGKIGRTEIIAHGTTIDPEYFRDKPFYPLTPTLGCLCAKELWNNSTGHLLVSDQYSLVSTFTSTPGQKGYLLVINLDNQQKAVSRAEIERWVDEFEKKK